MVSKHWRTLLHLEDIMQKNNNDILLPLFQRHILYIKIGYILHVTTCTFVYPLNFNTVAYHIYYHKNITVMNIHS